MHVTIRTPGCTKIWGRRTERLNRIMTVVLCAFAMCCACAHQDPRAAVPGTAGRSQAAPASSSLPASQTGPGPREIAAADLADHLGDSVETAVPVPVDAPNEGVDFQNRWIYDHFGRFRKQKFGMGHAPGSSGHERHYDVITFELPDGSLHTAYFDMTEFWQHAPPPPH